MATDYRLTPDKTSATAWQSSQVQPADKKDVADAVLEFFSSTGPLQTTLGGINENVTAFGNTINGANLSGKVNEDVYKRLKYQYANLYVATAVGGASNLIGETSEGINKSLLKASETITNQLKPVSSFIGSTLGTLTGVMKDPLGSAQDLPNTIGSMLDKLNPGLKASYIGTYKKYNIEKLAEMPATLFGGLQQISRSADKLINMPVALISDIYKGFMDFMGQLNDFVNGLFEGLQKFFDSIMDSLFPGLMDFLNQLTAFANQIGGIATIFGGANQITGFTNQLISGVNQLGSFIQSPLDLAFAYAPPEVSQTLYSLQNPQAIINQFLPPELSEYTAKLSQITGYGFNGNMGFGLQSVLEGIQGGVFASILEGFATQFSILSPIFTGQSVQPPSFPNSTTEATTPDGTAYAVGTTGQIVKTEQTKPTPSYGADALASLAGGSTSAGDLALRRAGINPVI